MCVCVCVCVLWYACEVESVLWYACEVESVLLCVFRDGSDRERDGGAGDGGMRAT